jgi:hypothetical protein
MHARKVDPFFHEPRIDDSMSVMLDVISLIFLLSLSLSLPLNRSYVKYRHARGIVSSEKETN